MSVAATAWAWRQRLPLKPKFVLVTLADQTDERTGRVCYGQTDLTFLAEKCAMPVRSLSRCIAALIRNGYMVRESGKDRGKASLYWLCLDRPIAAAAAEFLWTGTAADDEPQDVEGGSATMADPESADEGEGGRPNNGLPGRPIDGLARLYRRPKNVEAVAEQRTQAGFSRQAQDLERESFRLGQSAAKAGLGEFVIEGTRAWKAWSDYRHSQGLPRTIPTCWGVGEHSDRRGWFFPSLFPPSSTGPPKSPEEEDLDYFAEHG